MIPTKKCLMVLVALIAAFGLVTSVEAQTLHWNVGGGANDPTSFDWRPDLPGVQATNVQGWGQMAGDPPMNIYGLAVAGGEIAAVRSGGDEMFMFRNNDVGTDSWTQADTDAAYANGFFATFRVRLPDDPNLGLDDVNGIPIGNFGPNGYSSLTYELASAPGVNVHWTTDANGDPQIWGAVDVLNDDTTNDRSDPARIAAQQNTATGRQRDPSRRSCRRGRWRQLPIALQLRPQRRNAG